MFLRDGFSTPEHQPIPNSVIFHAVIHVHVAPRIRNIVVETFVIEIYSCRNVRNRSKIKGVLRTFAVQRMFYITFLQRT